MNKQDIESLVRSNIRSLCPYSTARDEYQGALGIFLDANENPNDTGFNRYPDPRQRALKEKLSAIKKVPVENIFLGNGSDEAIDLVYRVFCECGRDNAVIISPSYGMYSVAAHINDVECRMFQLEKDFTLDKESLLSECDERTKVIFLCSPNNPSGNAFPAEDIIDIVKRFNGIVVVDEAYADFSSEISLKEKVREYPNLIVLQTLSKAWGLAALRLGMAFADEYVIRLFSAVKYPYNIGKATLDAVSKALDRNISGEVSEIISEREMLSDRLPAFPFVKKVWPSDANFLLVQVDDADRLYDHLLADGIIVRKRNSIKGCEGCLRITVGLKEENVSLLNSLNKYKSAI